MAKIPFTPEQRRAIEAMGHSVVVTAAAGSGKTAVLAERCAYLVCDAPPEARCDVDRLLVLTFTDAAAGEMRGRIVEALRQRLECHPGDARLREQVALTDAAQISTIHSFCLRLIRKWFTEAQVDPAATLLDEHEVRLLRRDVLDEVLERNYAQQDRTACSLGTTGDDVGAASAFARLVDVYGLGSDRQIAKLVLDLDEFTTSLVSPDSWLEDAVAIPRDEPDRVILEVLSTLPDELERQIEHGRLQADRIDTGIPHAAFAKDRILTHVAQLRAWRESISDSASGTGARLRSLESACDAIRDFTFDRKSGPRLSKDTDDETRRTVEAARKRYSRIKDLFKNRLQNRYALFTPDEWRDGLHRIAPYIETIVSLVRQFREAYDTRKRELNVLDFSDLERLAHKILSEPSDLRQPSPIARALHDTYAYVLVDEFQDINPLQQEVLRLASHEAADDAPGNLFVVGDVKQSIYRFRLAEPALFVERLRRFRDHTAHGEAISLQKNFRSRAHLLDAINDVFAALMPPGAGAVEYDDEAVLRPGREEPETAPSSVELHVVDRAWQSDDAEDEGDESDGDATDSETAPTDDISERRLTAPDDPSTWTPIEREGYLIGRRIQAILKEEPSIRYRDVAVLLRAAKVNAERLAAMLTAMNIPAYAAVGGSLFAAVEVRDVLALLQVLDNARQDIPLAAVLRSGIVAAPLNEADLLRIRLLDPKDDFHRVVHRYPREGEDADLRGKVDALLQRIERLRADAACTAPADLMWRIYHEFGHLAYCCGLPGGPQRRANLLEFHQLARSFGSFRRQGLARFLRFIEGMANEDADVPIASPIGEAEDVVRIMTIHQSKGLEFPVVFVAGLGNRFNLGDRSGRMVYARRTRIGLRVVDTEDMIEYPSAAHLSVVEEIEREARAEELRVLYVAMTRARDRLILVGSQRHVDRLVDEDGSGAAGRPSAHTIHAAASFLDWLVPVIRSGSHAIGTGELNGKRAAPGGTQFDMRVHTADSMADWRTEATGAGANVKTREAVAALKPLPDSEPRGDDGAVEEVERRLAFAYPHLPTCGVPATIAASEYKGLVDFAGAPEATVVDAAGPTTFAVPPSKYDEGAEDAALHRGVLTHRILERLDFDAAADASGVASELQRMIDEGIVRAEDRDAVDVASLEWFVTTPLAAAMREAKTAFRREWQYVSAEPPSSFEGGIAAGREDFVLVRGVVDGILPVDGGLEVIDYKTDDIDASEVAQRAARYRPQVALYARAVSRLMDQPVTACRLVFLSPRCIYEFDRSEINNP